jgi:hypothetical protein
LHISWLEIHHIAHQYRAGREASGRPQTGDRENTGQEAVQEQAISKELIMKVKCNMTQLELLKQRMRELEPIIL